MLDSIHIKKFKKIQSDQSLNLKDFTDVNYLVGKNGSGKSSILSAISYLLDPTNSKNFFKKESELVATDSLNRMTSIIWDENDPNKVRNDKIEFKPKTFI